MKKILLITLSIISFGLIGQNMVLNQKTMNSSSYSLADISKITFKNGDMVIDTKSSTENFSIAGVRNLIFAQVITKAADYAQAIQELSVYPNPCGDELNLSQKTTNARYFIYDLNGSLIQSDKASSIINVSELTTGIYFFTLVSKTNTQTLKIIKK